MPAAAPSPEQARLLKRWRVSVFFSTWLSYVGLYFCRKPFYIVKPDLTLDLGLDASALGDIGMVYLGAYTVGQFAAGTIGAWTGARKLLLAGMAVSLACNLVFGGAASYRTLMVFSAINGLAQATGWSGGVGTMAHWTTRTERGTIMGLWATCYLVGGILANSLASFMLWWVDWRAAFFAGAVVLGLVIVVFFFMQRNRPEDVGLPPLDDGAGPDAGPTDEPGDASSSGRAAADRGGLGWSAQVVVTLLVVGGFYFCVKFIRYALWSWSPYFLRLNYGLHGHGSGFLSTIFDGAGFFGVMSAGVISDRLFGGRRALIALIMLLGMIAGCVALWRAGDHSLTLFAVGLGVVGFMLYGPDSLLSGAGAIDLGGRRGAILAAGVINGMGAVGSVVQEKLIGVIYASSGGELDAILLWLLGAAVLSVLFVGVVLVRNRVGQSDL